TLGVIVFGFYGRWCYELPILPNEQGIQLFFGAQNGVVWNEGNFLFLPRPFWSIWKRVSIQHFSFTVSSQNRSMEGHSMMVFATGRAKPVNVQLLSKMSQEGVQEQTLGFCMTAIARYIHSNTREVLLNYPNWDITETVEDVFGESDFYGLEIQVFSTKVVEVNQKTMEQFDMLARNKDMETVMSSLRISFPNMSDVELYSMYASMVGVNPTVMSYVVHGNGNNAMIFGRDTNSN
ncbi:MAG: hypothetical protein KBB50_03050, partial [Candidatus Pacebacteria bacterium]|nr:hypothetical protein [Candidatus Paceibacterota bacterium]